MEFTEFDYLSDVPFALESGNVLPSLRLRYAVHGKINHDKSNVALIFHALTGSSNISEWWSEIIGDGKALDTSRFAFICANYIGSCYGSTGADSLKIKGKDNKEEFALVTVRDIVRSQAVLLEHLKIERLKAVAGGSVGGMCALQMAADFPELIEKCVAVGASPLSAFGLALNHLQRKALDIENDVQLARQLATLSYKSAELFDVRFNRRPNRNGENPREHLNSRFDVAGYLDYQGEIFTKRFNADSYRLITKAMDLFDLSDEEIQKIKARVSLVGISSDWLFPMRDVENLARRMNENGARAKFVEFVSPDGHDAFLSDTKRMSEILETIFAEDETAEARAS